MVTVNWTDVVNVVVLFALAAITAWYARSTARMVAEMHEHSLALQRSIRLAQLQAVVMAKAAQVQAWGALISAQGHPPDQNPFVHLRQLVAELDAIASEYSAALAQAQAA
jgi:LPS sulfotransferase NodH